MFYYISGVLAYANPTTAVIDAGGVGYKLTISENTYNSLPPRHTQEAPQVKLFTYMAVREDDVELFGFANEAELSSFKMLLGVSGVGPKAAMAILTAGPQNFTLAVMTGDEKLLTAAQGVGKKLAQRIILELKDKIGGGSMELDFSGGMAAAAPVQQGNNAALARAALQELGYSSAEISAALKGVDPKATTEEMVRYALRQMVMKN